jgi:hypothetical protein
MIEVPQSTVERPLTAIDFIASLQTCSSLSEVQQFSSRCPLEVRQDDRFGRAVARRLGEIKGRKAAA